MAITFNKFNVTNGTDKARVYYSKSSRIDGRESVTLYDKDYGHDLGKIFSNEYKNDTDIMTDYSDKGQVVLFSDNPLYAEALKRC
jgi:hypothetical protein